MYDGNTICYPDKNFDAVVKAGRYEVIGILKQWKTICMLRSDRHLEAVENDLHATK